MKIKKLLLLALLLVTYANGQNLSITYLDNTKKQIEGRLNYNDEGIIYRISTKEKNRLSLENIDYITSKNKKIKIKKYKNAFLGFEVLIENDLSLFKSKKKYFLESEEFNFREVPFKEKNGYTFNILDAGVIGVFVNKCKTSQNYIHNNFNEITVSKLKKIVNSYNKCDLNENIVVSNQSILNANKDNEKIQFGITIGNSFLNADYNGILIDHTEKYGLFNVGAALYFRPNILNRKFYYKLSINYMLDNKGTFYASQKNVRTRHGYIEAVLGANYLFLKANSKINPYLGVNGGAYFNNGSKITVDSGIVGGSYKHFTSVTELIYNINAGLLFELSNQKFDFNISYLPSTKFGLNTGAVGENDAYHTLKGLSFKLSYYF